jgi:hypothetical protein
MEALLVLVLVLAASAVAWFEARIGRYKLRRFVEKRGYVLRKARWRGPFISMRQVQFNVELEREGQMTAGRAYVGGLWTGPVFSTSVTFDLGQGDAKKDLPDHR